MAEHDTPEDNAEFIDAEILDESVQEVGTETELFGGTISRTNPDSEIEIRSRLSDSELSEITSFEDAFKLAQKYYGNEIVRSFELGDGFTELLDKSKLVGVPFIVLGWGLGHSEFGDETDPNNRYSILRVVTEPGDKYRIYDGSSGIHQTLMDKFQGDPANFRAIVAVSGLAAPKPYTPRNPDGTPLLDAKGQRVGKAVTYRFDVEDLGKRA